MRGLVVLFPFLGVLACSPTPEGKLTEAQVEQRFIYHGSTIDQPHHDATVSLHRVFGSNVTYPFCSGTLIFDRWVLTAAHCVEGLTGSDVMVKFGEEGVAFGAHQHFGASVTVHDGWNRAALVDDIALVELIDAPTYAEPVMPLPTSIGLTEADEGSSVDLAGFGLQEDGSAYELLHVVKELDDVRDTQIQYDQGDGLSSTGGVCNGDSGGPAFFERNGQIYVAGLTSYGDSSCMNYAVSTKVDAYQDFIEETTGHSVQPVASEEPVEPVDTGVEESEDTGVAEDTGVEEPVDTGGEPVDTGVEEPVEPEPSDVVDVIEDFVPAAGVNILTYTTTTPGTHTIRLAGEAGADVDLYLGSNTTGRWKVRGSSTSTGPSETITVEAPTGGWFAVAVVGVTEGDYSLVVVRPQ